VIDVTSRADDHDVASTALTGVSARRRARRPQALPALPEPIGQFTTRSGHVSAGKAARRTAELDEGPPRQSISFSAEGLRVKVSKLGNEARLVIKAAQIENERTILEAADDRYG
jgi:hypothetical protein